MENNLDYGLVAIHAGHPHFGHSPGYQRVDFVEVIEEAVGLCDIWMELNVEDQRR